VFQIVKTSLCLSRKFTIDLIQLIKCYKPSFCMSICDSYVPWLNGETFSYNLFVAIFSAGTLAFLCQASSLFFAITLYREG